MTSYLKPKNTTEHSANPRPAAPSAPAPGAAEFVPNDRQRRAKAALQAAVAEGRASKGTLGFADAAELSRLCKTPMVQQWASQPGFMAWFVDTENFGSRIAYLLDLALEAAEQVLLDPDPKSNSAKVALMTKLIGLKQDVPEEKRQLGEEELKQLIRANRHIVLALLAEPDSLPIAPTLPAGITSKGA